MDEPKVIDTQDNAIESDHPEIFKLNEDCLIQLFKYCDAEMLLDLSDTCKLFNGLVNSNGFKNVRTLTLRLSQGRISMTFARARRILEKTGKHITILYIDWPYICSRGSSQYETEYDDFVQFSQIVNQYVGRQIERINFDENLQMHLDRFRPVLKHVKCLRAWHGDYSAGFYQTECLKLVKLDIGSSATPIQLRSTWLTLRTFKFGFYRDDDFIEVAQHMINLEKLTIRVAAELKETHLSRLMPLCHLTKLHLKIFGFSNANEVLRCLSGFVHLKELKLRIAFKVPELDQQLIIQMAEKIQNLEHVLLAGFELEAKTLLTFVATAPKLKKLHIHKDCNTTTIVTRQLIMDMVEVLKTTDRGELKLFLDKDVQNDLRTLDNAYIQNILKLCFDCSHRVH